MTLADRVRKTGATQFSEGIDFTIAALDIVSHCHKNEVVHRDIKPRNIVLRDGSMRGPVLVDFGISFVEDIEDNLTDLRDELGPRFLRLADLSAGSAAKRDIRTDVTLCVGLLFYVLTARTPDVLFDTEGRMPHQIPAARFTLEKSCPSPEVLRRLLEIFDQGFQLVMAHRWQSADDLRDRLLRIMTENTEPLTVANMVDRLNERHNRPAELAAVDTVTKLQLAITAIERVQMGMTKPGEWGFARCSSGDQETRWLGFNKVTASHPHPPWLVFRSQQIGAELVLFVGTVEDKIGTEFHRTSLESPEYSDDFRDKVEALFMKHILDQAHEQS